MFELVLELLHGVVRLGNSEWLDGFELGYVEIRFCLNVYYWVALFAFFY
jgi:hypothetical protein